MAPPKPYMPPVDETLSEAALIQVFEQARATSAGRLRRTGGSDPPDQRYIALITPGRLICQLPTNRPNSMDASAVRPIEALLPRTPPKYVVAIAFYTWSPSMSMRELSATIPFFGFLMGFAYIGHNVVVFEGHASAFKAALHGADMLVVDADMAPFLPKGWPKLARQVMRTPEINIYNRSSVPPVKRLLNQGDDAKVARSKALTASEYHLRHQVRAAEGDVAGAMEDLTQALRLEPERAEILIDRAVLRRQTGDSAGALADLEQALRLDARSGLAYRERGTTYYYQQHWQQAVENFTQALRLLPDDFVAFRQRGFAYCNLQEWDRAIEDSTQAIQINPSSPDAYNDRATAKRGKGDPDGAIADCTEALRVMPNYYYAYANRADAKIQKGDYDGAIADADTGTKLLEALLSQDRIKQDKYARGIGMMTAMRETATERKSSQPPNEQVSDPVLLPTPAAPAQFEEFMEFITSGRELFIAKKYDSAIRQFSRALELDPNSVTALELRGKAHIADKDYQGAVEDFSKLIELAENSKQKAIFHTMRGQAREHLKRFGEAADDFQQAIEADPDYIPAQENLEQLQSGGKRRTVRW
ncbi:MAG: tetratricopeptide repeat protein [Aggregatilineales bacterium]